MTDPSEEIVIGDPVPRRGRPRGSVKNAEIVIDKDKIPAELNVGKEPALRAPKGTQLQKYEHVVERLDGCIDHVMDRLIEMVDDPDPNIRLRVCEMLLKRYIPEKKVKEIVGANGGPVQINQNTDIRQLTLSVVGVLDEFGLEEIREKSASGSFRLIDDDAGTKG